MKKQDYYKTRKANRDDSVTTVHANQIVFLGLQPQISPGEYWKSILEEDSISDHDLSNQVPKIGFDSFLAMCLLTYVLIELFAPGALGVIWRNW